MFPASRKGPNLAGSSNKIDQLQHVSLADGASNTLIGINSGTMAKTRGVQNTCIGANAATLGDRTDYCVLVGSQAGEHMTTAGNVVGVGQSTFREGFAVYDTVAVGSRAAEYMTRSSEDVLVGYKAGQQVSSASRTVAVGAYSGYRGTSFKNDTFVGAYSGIDSVGSNNVFVGCSAGIYATVNDSIIIGAGAGANVSGNDVVIIGKSGNGSSTGNGSTLVGSGAGSNASGDFVTDVGYNTGQNWIGSNVTFMGAYAGYEIGRGNLTTGMGFYSLGGGAVGERTSAFGAYSGLSWNGNNNTFLGTLSGALGTGSNNVIAGVALGVDASATLQDTVVIGSNISTGTLSSSVVVGGGLDTTNISGNVVFIGSNFTLAGSDAGKIVIALNGGRSLTAGDGEMFVGSNVDPYLLANNTGYLSLGRSATRALVATTANVQLGPTSDPFFSADTGGNLFAGVSAARALTSTTLETTLGSLSDPFFYANTGGTVKIGPSGTNRALSATATSIKLGSDLDSFFSCTDAGTLTIGTTSKRIISVDSTQIKLGGVGDASAYYILTGAVNAVNPADTVLRALTGSDIILRCDQTIAFRDTVSTSSVFKFYTSNSSAYKTTGTTWDTSSDRRVKMDIVDADLDKCYELVKNLKLMRFGWKPSFEPYARIRDKHVVGWIAQEVEKVFPKSVSETDSTHVEPDDPVGEKFHVKSLDSDQILKTMYGAVQKLMQKTEVLEAENLAMRKRIDVLEAVRKV